MLVFGALIVGALAFVLLREVTSHPDAPSTSAPVTPGAAGPSSSASASADSPAPVEEHARAVHSAAHAAPSLAPSIAASNEVDKPKHVDTPTDITRWSLMRAVRNSEPAVIECLDHAKSPDGSAIYEFYVTMKNDKAVISRPGVAKSSFPEALNSCVEAALSSGELDQPLPEGQNEFRVERELVVEKGAISRYRLKSFLPP